MAKKTNGEAEIELQILKPEKFQTLQEIRDFVTGDGARALHFAIRKALAPETMLCDADEFEVKLRDELKDAREAAIFVCYDLGALAKGVIESEGDPEVVRDEHLGCIDKERRALLLIALQDGDTASGVRWELFEHLSSAHASTANA